MNLNTINSEMVTNPTKNIDYYKYARDQKDLTTA